MHVQYVPFAAAVAVLSSLIAGCAHNTPPSPVRVRLPDMASLPVDEVRAGRPLEIEIHEGETIPLDFSLDGDLLSAPEATTIPLLAKRNFWLRVDANGLSVSRDGVNFHVKPGTPGAFRFGVGATRERGVRATLQISTPRP